MSMEVYTLSYLISIHPPRGGWDLRRSVDSTALPISIHPPRGGWDSSGARTASTATDFNPPTPWGVGLRTWYSVELNHDISIHPPRGGWD